MYKTSKLGITACIEKVASDFCSQLKTMGEGMTHISKHDKSRHLYLKARPYLWGTLNSSTSPI